MTAPIEIIRRTGIVPVIAIERAQDAVPLADALLEGGLPVAEITFRTAAAADVIAAMHEKRPELCVGAGTILDQASLAAAIKAGAAYGLAPGFDAAIVAAAKAAGFPFAPGIMTPSDLTAAAAAGCRLVKFFPAGPAGGPGFLQAISAPFAHLGISVIPTGGVTEENLADWLKLKAVVAAGGTWVARTEDITAGNFAEITRRARSAVAAVARARGN
ncbi:2-keto-3-deoxy-phosphogluconate aldolase [Dongia mobilis]|uniref:2-dehydro-3-deoxy-phosphogluconate aldolase n=1 Tax=Dongia mobilis TaxID=578943 RepID=A0A4R6X0B1_9PROT|nr:bifunctional 4-hydroxy-2-oxoglutarate aldolase/2-dehydro-3-deoxy-phosphogluconate aldolase [Dongia mobilis]TDQ83878.1 2-keto-3-deoxy-phosphogluconate aldolase [Dongia mobilis]